MKLPKSVQFWTLFSLFVTCSMIHAQEGRMRPLPPSAWQLLEEAQGIQVGGPTGAKANVQIIFDVNCPHCAKLYETLRQEYPDITTRWVPIGYFRPDSASVAAAILHSPDPAASLQANYDHYNFTTRHGGLYGQDGQYLNAANISLRHYWQAWGGFTPMVVLRAADGEVLKSGIFSLKMEAISTIFQRAEPALKPYHPDATEGSN